MYRAIDMIEVNIYFHNFLIVFLDVWNIQHDQM